MNNFAELLRTLVTGRVDFILVGGVAATIHGASRLTQDIDIVYSRDDENMERMVQSLRPLNPTLRGAPPGLPFRWDSRTVTQGLNFTLSTNLGAIDLLGEITGGGNYYDLLPHSMTVNAFGIAIKCLELDWLIRVKRAAGRPKDFETISELEAILEEQRQDDT